MGVCKQFSPLWYRTCISIENQAKKSTKINFSWVRRPPGGVGVFHAKGWWPKSSCPPLTVCLPWLSKKGIWDVPGIFAGMSRSRGGVQKVCAKRVCAHFPSLIKAHLSFKSPSPKPHLNRTGSVLALPTILTRLKSQRSLSLSFSWFSREKIQNSGIVFGRSDMGNVIASRLIHKGPIL